MISTMASVSPFDWPRRALKAIDSYTEPRPTTAGDLEKNDYIQPLFHAGAAGFAFMGMTGVGIASLSSFAGTLVARKTGSQAAALVAGALSGLAGAAAIGAMTGGVGLGLAVGGTLLGGVQALRGHRKADVRDAAGGATMITGMFLPGTAKIASAIAAGVGAEFESKTARALAGAACGAALGAGLGALGLGGGLIASTVLSAIGGGIGPFFGPRFSQFFRNLANDTGRGLASLARRAGVSEKYLGETTANVVGSFPAQFAKEAVRGFVNSDGNLVATVVGGVVEGGELAQLFLAQAWEKRKAKKMGVSGDPVAPAAKPPAHDHG